MASLRSPGQRTLSGWDYFVWLCYGGHRLVWHPGSIAVPLPTVISLAGFQLTNQRTEKKNPVCFSPCLLLSTCVGSQSVIDTKPLRLREGKWVTWGHQRDQGQRSVPGSRDSWLAVPQFHRWLLLLMYHKSNTESYQQNKKSAFLIPPPNPSLHLSHFLLEAMISFSDLSYIFALFLNKYCICLNIKQSCLLLLPPTIIPQKRGNLLHVSPYKTLWAGFQWLMPVIPAAWEAEIGRTDVRSQPGKIVGETPPPK
jgi:hypothetical protein